MPDWPRPYHRIVDGVIDRSRTVQVYPHSPGGSEALRAWCGDGDVVEVSGGTPVFIVPSNRPCSERLVGLGDVVVEDRDQQGTRRLTALPGGQLGARLWPADADGPPPVD